MTQTVLLGDIADIQTGPFGSQLHQEDYVDEGTPIITVEHLGGDRITTQNLPRVSDDDKQRLTKYWMREGDTIFSRVGSVDRASYVHREEDGWLFSGRCLRVRPDAEKVDPRYLSFVLRSPQFTSYIKSIAVGATMPSVNTKLLSTAPVVLIPRDAQEKVAATLDAIEQKIELNRQMNETLEQLGQALFRHYFIDNPEADKWGKTAVGSRIKPRRGKSLQSKNMIPGDVPVVSGGLQPAGLHSESNTKAPVITVSASGANAGYIALWNKNVWSADSSFIDTTITPHVYFYYLLLSRNQKRIYEMQTGSGQPHIYPSHIELLELPNAPEELIVEFNNEVAMNFEKIEENKQEIQTLTALRDTLLPRLISGKVKV